MSREMKLCQFCKQLGFHPKAHIAPRSMYLQDDDIPFKAFKLSGEVRPKRSRTGVYDPNLWCERCEQDSAELDDHAAKYLLNATEYLDPICDHLGWPLLRTDGHSVAWTMREVDTLKLHLFVLSVLWRASASIRPEVASCRLGPYQNKIKEIIRTRDHLKLQEIPYLLRYELDPDMRGGFTSPSRTRIDGVVFATFLTGGFSFLVKVSQRAMPRSLSLMANSPTEPVKVLSYRLLETEEGRYIAKGAKAVFRKFGSQ